MLASWKKNYNKLRVIKSRDITLPTKVYTVKAMVFPVATYGCESCTIKKVEHRKMDAFELQCWRTHLRVPWAVRRSNQWTLKETNPEYSLEGLMLKLKPQYFGHLMQRTDSLKKTQLDGHEFEQALGVGDGQGSLVCCSPWGLKESNTIERLDWTEC